MRLFRNILSLLLAGLLFISPIFVPVGYFKLTLFSLHPDKSIFGYQFGTFASGFIHPPFTQDDVLILRRCEPEDVQVGDIILVLEDAPINITESLTREVVRVMTDYYGEPGLWFATMRAGVTWEDPPIPAERFVAKIVGRMPGIGRLEVMQLATVLSILICWGLALLVLIRLALQGRRRIVRTERRAGGDAADG